MPEQFSMVRGVLEVRITEFAIRACIFARAVDGQLLAPTPANANTSVVSPETRLSSREILLFLVRDGRPFEAMAGFREKREPSLRSRIRRHCYVH